MEENYRTKYFKSLLPQLLSLVVFFWLKLHIVGLVDYYPSDLPDEFATVLVVCLLSVNIGEGIRAYLAERVEHKENSGSILEKTDEDIE
ncbi:MAG: hypothetical protein FWD45_05890 [Coriobacteriia bacterium]|nr:hypothetical protein [Coriobacteriia bacterium]